MLRHIRQDICSWDDRGTEADVDLKVPEVAAGVAELQQHGVGQRLPGQRGARCPEGHGHLVLGRDGQDLLNLLLRVHLQGQLLTRQAQPALLLSDTHPWAGDLLAQTARLMESQDSHNVSMLGPA